MVDVSDLSPLPAPAAIRVERLKLLDVEEYTSSQGTPFLGLWWQIVGSKNYVVQPVVLKVSTRWVAVQVADALMRNRESRPEFFGAETVQRWVGRTCWGQLRYESSRSFSGWRVHKLQKGKIS
jgi:hypothetical protein